MFQNNTLPRGRTQLANIETTPRNGGEITFNNNNNNTNSRSELSNSRNTHNLSLG